MNRELLDEMDLLLRQPNTSDRAREALRAATKEILRLARFEKMYEEATLIVGDEECLLYVKSSNSIPVTRCTISADLLRQLVEGRRESRSAGGSHGG